MSRNVTHEDQPIEKSSHTSVVSPTPQPLLYTPSPHPTPQPLSYTPTSLLHPNLSPTPQPLTLHPNLSSTPQPLSYTPTPLPAPPCRHNPALAAKSRRHPS